VACNALNWRDPSGREIEWVDVLDATASVLMVFQGAANEITCGQLDNFGEWLHGDAKWKDTKDSFETERLVGEWTWTAVDFVKGGTKKLAKTATPAFKEGGELATKEGAEKAAKELADNAAKKAEDIVPPRSGPALASTPGGEGLYTPQITGQSVAPHGNSLDSVKPHHRYEIKRTDTGEVAKTGVSGQPINKDGSSPRANRQVNDWNKTEGAGTYKAEVMETNLPGRSAALEAEKNATKALHAAGHPLDKQVLPKP
jgi:hypothetical protein